nr:glycosyltransferase family 39 protein [uncultured Methanospirillum sp.]
MNDRTTLLLCFASCIAAALILLLSRAYPSLAPISLIFFGLAVWFCTNSQRPGFCLVAVAATTTLVLVFRFPYLTWGDPWQDYESVWEVIVQGSTATAGYRLQQPVFPVIVSAFSGFLSIQPMLAQKMIVPLVGSLSVSILYFIGREYTDRTTALTASLIYLSSIPYLHWASQGVREALGIPFFLLSIYFSHRAVRTGRVSDILLSFCMISGLILAHHQSAFMFSVIFPVMTLAEIYLFRSDARIKREAGIICLILGFSLLFMLTWWRYRLSFIYISFIDDINKITPFHSIPGIVQVIGLFLLFICFAYLPSICPGVTRPLRYLMHWISKRVWILQVGGFFIAIGGVVLLVTSLAGYSFLAVRYPVPMIFAGVLILILALIGVPEFLTSKRFPLLLFAAVPLILLGIGLTRAIPGIELLWNSQIDPLRFLGYLWPPVALMAGAGIIRLFRTDRQWQLGVTIIFLFMLTTTFPSIVMMGTSFEKGTIWYDNRSLVISHPETEIQAVEWFGNEKTNGILTSDRYAFSVARWLNTQGSSVKEPVERPSPNSRYEYWLLTSRMDTYANFVEWITQVPHPVTAGERQMMDDQSVRMYDNGDAVLYRNRGSGQN